MRNSMRKIILLLGMTCMMSLALCACGDEAEMQDLQETESEAEAEDSQDGESETDMGDSQDKENAGVTEDLERDSSQAEPPKSDTELAADSWTDTAPNLEGDIKDIQDGKLTVIEAILEKSDNGGDIMVSPAEGADDSGFNKITVIYDENTLFAIRKIYDGGARYEMSEGTASDLDKGQMVKVWGNYTGSELKAEQICIVKVA